MVFLQQVRKMPFLRIVIPYLTGLIAGYYLLPIVALRILAGACARPACAVVHPEYRLKQSGTVNPGLPESWFRLSFFCWDLSTSIRTEYIKNRLR